MLTSILIEKKFQHFKQGIIFSIKIILKNKDESLHMKINHTFINLTKKGITKFMPLTGSSIDNSIYFNDKYFFLNEFI